MIPFETGYEKRGGLLRPIARKKNLVSLRLAAFLPFFYVLWFTPKNFTIEPFDIEKNNKKNPEERLKESIVYLKVAFQG